LSIKGSFQNLFALYDFIPVFLAGIEVFLILWFSGSIKPFAYDFDFI